MLNITLSPEAAARFKELLAEEDNEDAVFRIREVKVGMACKSHMELRMGIDEREDEDEEQEVYEVRTRKILLISNAIASSSTVINTTISKNPKNLDIGSLLNTVSRLFSDMRFITKIKKEFIENEISNRLQREIKEIDELFGIM